MQLAHGKILKGLEQFLRQVGQQVSVRNFVSLVKPLAKIPVVSFDFLFQPSLPQVLDTVFEGEMDGCLVMLGVYFQTHSVFASLLSITTIPPSLVEGINMKSPALEPWTSLRGFPERPHWDEVKNLEVQENNTCLSTANG